MEQYKAFYTQIWIFNLILTHHWKTIVTIQTLWNYGLAGIFNIDSIPSKYLIWSEIYWKRSSNAEREIPINLQIQVKFDFRFINKLNSSGRENREKSRKIQKTKWPVQMTKPLSFYTKTLIIFRTNICKNRRFNF